MKSKIKNQKSKTQFKLKNLLFFIFCFLFLVSFPIKVKAFQDIPADHWARGAVQELRSEGVIKGFIDNTFRGKEKLTRYEMAVWLKRLETAILKQAAIREKLIRELAAETAEVREELKVLKTLTK